MKSVYWLLAGVMVFGSVHAAPVSVGPAPGAAAAPQTTNPAVALRAGMDRLLGFLGGEQPPAREQLAAFLNAEIAPFFDFSHMAKSAGGRLFEQMGAAERQKLVASVRQSFLARMAEKLAGYERQQVRFMPPRAGNDGRTAQVSVAILNPGRYPSRLDFRLYRGAEGWKVYDVAANGQSAIVHYRRQLMRQVQEQRMRQMRRMSPPMRPAVPQSRPGYRMR